VVFIGNSKKKKVTDFWESVIWDDEVDLKDRLKASELLAKTDDKKNESVTLKIKVEYE